MCHRKAEIRVLLFDKCQAVVTTCEPESSSLCAFILISLIPFHLSQMSPRSACLVALAKILVDIPSKSQWGG